MAELTNNESVKGFTHIYTATYEDLQSIGNGGQATIATIPAGGAVECVGVYESEAFAGTSSLVIDIGTDSSDPDEFIDALDVDNMGTGTTNPVFNTGDQFTGGQSQPVKAVSADTSVLLEVTDAAIASATAGKIVVGLRIIELGQFA